MKFPNYFIVLNVLLLVTAASAQRTPGVSAFVKDNNTKQPLVYARVELWVGGKMVRSTVTGSSGDFSLQIENSSSFELHVSMAGYNTRVLPSSEFKRLYDAASSADAKTIFLSKQTVTSTEKSAFVRQKLTELHFLPTRGAYTLLYATNPGLKDSVSVSSKYNFKTPVLPKFTSVKKTFKKRFKKDKNREEPYVYTRGGNVGINNENLMREPKLHQGSLISIETGMFSKEQYPDFYSSTTKKFVFVIFKIGEDGHPVYENYRYTVYYYPTSVAGHEELYNKTPDATYGYAPMKAKIYNIEIYDQQRSFKRVKIGDDQIDPEDFFLRHELINSWIKVPIQVYE